MIRPRLSLLAVVACALGLGVAPAAQIAAQTAGQEEQTYSEAELVTYALAASEVQRIAETYRPVLDDAQSVEEQDSIREEATIMMVAAIQESGMSLEKFNEISMHAQSDPELASRIEQYRQGL